MIQNPKTKLVFGGLSTLALGALLAGCGGNNANTSTAPDTAPDTSTTTTAPPATTAPKMGTTTVAPAASSASFKDASATWKQVTAANAALDKVIKSKNLKTVHEAAFKVRDIVKTLHLSNQPPPLRGTFYTPFLSLH